MRCKNQPNQIKQFQYSGCHATVCSLNVIRYYTGSQRLSRSSGVIKLPGRLESFRLTAINPNYSFFLVHWLPINVWTLASSNHFIWSSVTSLQIISSFYLIMFIYYVKNEIKIPKWICIQCRAHKTAGWMIMYSKRAEQEHLFWKCSFQFSWANNFLLKNYFLSFLCLMGD